MTRNQRINKLARAVWEYRGRYDPATGKWFQPPKPKAEVRILKWLTDLGLDVTDSMKKIDGFQKREDFEKWIRSIPNGHGDEMHP